MSVVNPPIDTLLEQVDSKFTLCTLAAKRARQINDMIGGVRSQALNVMSASEVARITEEKPLTIALNEVEKGDIKDSRA